MQNLYEFIEKRREEIINKAKEDAAIQKKQREEIYSMRNNYITHFFNIEFLDNFESNIINTINECKSVDKLDNLKIQFEFSKFDPSKYSTNKKGLSYSGINDYVPADNTCIDIFGTIITRDLYDEIMTYIKNICAKYDLKAYYSASYIPTENATLSIYGEPKRMADMIYDKRELYQKQAYKMKIRKK